MTADYTDDEAIRDVLLSGISDADIRREAMGMDDIQSKPVNEVIAFVEGREMARNATPTSYNFQLKSAACWGHISGYEHTVIYIPRGMDAMLE